VAWLKAGLFYIYSRMVVLNQGWKCLQTYLVVTIEEEGGAEARVVAKHPTMHKTTPTTQNYPSTNE